MKELCRLVLTCFLLTPLQSVACEHLALGTPKQSDFVKCRIGYAIGYNYKIKSAEWVSYLLVGTNKDGVERIDDFRADLDIPEQYRTTPNDYEEPIYDRGHLANSESIDSSIGANSETFLMSNMTPQLPGHNIAIWKGLENRERKWALARKSVLVFTGPLYEGAIASIGANKVPVPSHYWKVIYDINGQDVIGFLIPHKALKTSELNNFIVTIDEIEKRADVDLLSLLPDELEDSIESKQQTKQW